MIQVLICFIGELDVRRQKGRSGKLVHPTSNDQEATTLPCETELAKGQLIQEIATQVWQSIDQLDHISHSI